MSASVGPPSKAFSASALMGRPDGRSAFGSVLAVGSLREASAFSILHLRSWFIPGSIAVSFYGFVKDEMWNESQWTSKG